MGFSPSILRFGIKQRTLFQVSDLTAVVLTKNEEDYIADCLDSLKWCDEVIVLDSLSTDRTIDIARQFKAKVLLRPFKNFADQRNAAIDIVKCEWILFVDADERVSKALAQEVQEAIQDSEYDGWWIPTRNNYFGHWLNYGGFWPDYHLRLARKGKLHYDSLQKVHERPDPIKRTGYLTHPINHICYQNIHDLKEAKARYATLLAEIHFEKGVKPTYHLITAPIVTFYDQLIVKKSYRDVWVGLLISLVWAYYAFDEYRRLLILWITSSKRRIRRT